MITDMNVSTVYKKKFKKMKMNITSVTTKFLCYCMDLFNMEFVFLEV